MALWFVTVTGGLWQSSLPSVLYSGGATPGRAGSNDLDGRSTAMAQKTKKNTISESFELFVLF